MGREMRCCPRPGSFVASRVAEGGCTQPEKGPQLRPTDVAGARKASAPEEDLLRQSAKLTNDSRNRNERHRSQCNRKALVGGPRVKARERVRRLASDWGTRSGCTSSWVGGVADLLNERQLTDAQQVRIAYSLNNSETTFLTVN